MTTHRFDLRPMTGRGMVTPCHYLGAEVLRSHAPIYDAARWLLDHGHADPADTVETWRDGMRCMSGIIGRVAEWTVTETNREGLRMVRWADVQAKRSRLDRLSSDSHFPHHGSTVDGQADFEGTEMPPDRGAPSLAPSHEDLIAELPIAA